MSIEVLDPAWEEAAADVTLAPRLRSLEGTTIGILSNGKEGTGPFFTHLAALLRERWQVREVVQRVKANYSAPAEASLMAEARGWDAVLSGIGD